MISKIFQRTCLLLVLMKFTLSNLAIIITWISWIFYIFTSTYCTISFDEVYKEQDSQEEHLDPLHTSNTVLDIFCKVSKTKELLGSFLIKKILISWLSSLACGKFDHHNFRSLANNYTEVKRTESTLQIILQKLSW